VCSSRSAASRAAYSMAATGSCTEHGPATTSNRSPAPSSTGLTSARDSSAAVAMAAQSAAHEAMRQRKQRLVSHDPHIVNPLRRQGSSPDAGRADSALATVITVSLILI
jgi:hypothetical protein